MNSTGMQTINTERLKLRRFEISDAEAMFKNWSSNSDVTKYLTWQPHKSVDETKEILSQWINSYSDSGYFQRAIELKELGEPIGSIGVVFNDKKQTPCISAIVSAKNGGTKA